MKPEIKLKYAILALQYEWNGKPLPVLLTDQAVEDLWDEQDCLQDAKSEIRCSGISTGVDCDYSRHYESKAVAVQCPNGDWVGFTYWSGGGKWGEPEAIDWMDKAYDVECKEEEKLVVVHTFTKKGEGK
jgi:hypothetical protein